MIELDRNNIEKIAKTADEKLMLGKVWDKLFTGMKKNIPANSAFLTPAEQQSVRYLFGDVPGLSFFGGYDEAERKMAIFLPDYLDPDYLWEEGSPIVCLRAVFFSGDAPGHRDFLGALIGSGIARQTIGDICVSSETCDFFVTSEIAPYLLLNFTNAGKAHVHLDAIPLSTARIPSPEVQVITDTVPSLRLTALSPPGFRIARSLAARYITSEKPPSTHSL